PLYRLFTGHTNRVTPWDFRILKYLSGGKKHNRVVIEDESATLKHLKYLPGGDCLSINRATIHFRQSRDRNPQTVKGIADDTGRHIIHRVGARHTPSLVHVVIALLVNYSVQSLKSHVERDECHFRVSLFLSSVKHLRQTVTEPLCETPIHYALFNLKNELQDIVVVHHANDLTRQLASINVDVQLQVHHSSLLTIRLQYASL